MKKIRRKKHQKNKVATSRLWKQKRKEKKTNLKLAFLKKTKEKFKERENNTNKIKHAPI